MSNNQSTNITNNSELVSIVFDTQSSPIIKLKSNQLTSLMRNNGWGIGWYPHDSDCANITKDLATIKEDILTKTITKLSSFRSSVFLCKLRGSKSDYTHKEVQPFQRSFAGRDWVFMHSGDLDKKLLEQLHGRQRRVLQPVGDTDSELAFCTLLENFQRNGGSRIADVDPQILHNWFKEFDALGSANMMLTDGDSMVCYCGEQGCPLYYGYIKPPDNTNIYDSDAIEFALKDPRDTYHSAFICTSAPFYQGNWQEMMAGQFIINKRSHIIWNSALGHEQANYYHAFAKPINPQRKPDNEQILNFKAITESPDGSPLNYRLLEVSHITEYAYQRPVEHSTHLFRLQPVEDGIQEVIQAKLHISSSAEKITFEDVFGNQSMYCTISKPYDKLTLRATSLVKIYATLPDDHSLSRRQASIPLVWMPWQRQMMMPYLLPSELPESQLTELTEYAMSFVERNNYHLLRVVEDMNLSIYRDYIYQSKSTSLKTTPFDVYTSRKGVCQDFANLLICLCRLLGIPARYRMGYIYTGDHYENQVQSDASHAWAELYLPYVGWRGFDPTNGCVVMQDHIRVACGRNYRDATPTSGTIYGDGGGKERLNTRVQVIDKGLMEH